MILQEYINNILYEYSYIELFGLSFMYFSILYFGLAPIFNGVCKYLASKNILHKITLRELHKGQIKFELKHSFISIILFGTSIIPVIYLIRLDLVSLLPNTILNVILGIIALTIWNEIHFFIVHRILHLRFFMRHIHYIHHQSRVPTVYSVYSFHWIEALLLSTVPLTFIPFVPISPVAIFLYPLASILLNYSGHCNYRFGNGQGASWKLFGTFHNEHHAKGRKNYGFASHILDKINFTIKSHFENTKKL